MAALRPQQRSDIYRGSFREQLKVNTTLEITSPNLPQLPFYNKLAHLLFQKYLSQFYVQSASTEGQIQKGSSSDENMS